MKTGNTEEENNHIFQATWRIMMRFSGKIWLIITVKVTKKQVCNFIFYVFDMLFPYLFFVQKTPKNCTDLDLWI